MSQTCTTHGLEVQILNLDKQFQGNRFQCGECLLYENQNNHRKVRIDQFLQNPSKALLSKIESVSNYNLEQVELDLEILQMKTNEIIADIRKVLKIFRESFKQLNDGIFERLKIKKITDLKDQLFEPQQKINLDDISNNYEKDCKQSVKKNGGTDKDGDLSSSQNRIRVKQNI